MKGRVFFKDQPTLQTSEPDHKSFCNSRICSDIQIHEKAKTVHVEFEDGSLEVYPIHEVKKLTFFRSEAGGSRK